MLNLEAVDLLGPVPLELFQGLDDGKAGRLQPPLDDALSTLDELTLDESAKILDVIPMLLGRLLGLGDVVLLEIGQLEIFEVLAE